MFGSARALLLGSLRVPSEPEPPPGDPERTLRFRASPRLLHYRRLVWATTQAGALGALLLGSAFFVDERMHFGLPPGAVSFLAYVTWAGFLIQLPVTWWILHLDFELRWYILSDRSLRIREGVLSVREQTMTFANVQQITVRQNPLQRLFGIADVSVRAAGGGGGSGASSPSGRSRSPREATFRGVDDALRIRDLIRARVRQHRDSGLGDPDEEPSGRGPPVDARPVGEAVAAARALLQEVRALRAASPRR